MLTFVVCVEPGSHRLEYKAATLFHTMRRNMGALSRADIWAYAPRPNRIVSPWCRELMDHFEVRFIDDPLNAIHADYPLANKPLCLAHAEQHALTEYITFLDTDILAWREPSGFLLGDGTDLALVADGTKTTASAGPGDRFEEYWTRLYELTGATARPFVTTILSDERVRGSWNSGVIALRRSAGIAGEWRHAMLRLLADDFSPREAMYLRENNLLSAVATKHFDRLRELSFAYNYPVQNWDRMSPKGVTPEDAVLWHYQPFFDKSFHRFENRMARTRTLRERLAVTEAQVLDLRKNYQRRIGMDETWFQSIRRRARVGPRLRALLGRSKPTDFQIS